jgi:DNA-binding CsgD family transcriptional regulator
MPGARLPGPTFADVLFGRDGELKLIGAFLGRARSAGAPLLLVGEAGIGKTALLDAAVRMASARGFRILQTNGAEFEAGRNFSALHQVLLPLRCEYGQVNPAHRKALSVALGLGGGPSPDLLTVSCAVLDLLRQTAVAHPLLIVVDNLPWLDRASATVLGFVARRLGGSSIGLLAAARSGHETFFGHSGLPEQELGPLDEASASALLGAHFPGLAPGVGDRLLAEARGNPLALLELPAALSGPQLAGLQALPAALPLGRRMRALFTARLWALPAQTRHLLLMAALDCTGDLRVLDTAGARGLEDLAAAERARLVSVRGNPRRLVFRQPLTRCAVVELATETERRAAHRALAVLWSDQLQRRAWHLAGAASGPDEEVAALLEQAAHRALHTENAAAARAVLTRAADLSPQPVDRGRRLAEAAYIEAEATGELSSASALLCDARRSDLRLRGSLHAAAAAAYVVLNDDGDLATAHRLLSGAIQTADHGYDAHDGGLIEAMHTLALLCWFSGTPQAWEPFYDALARLRPAPPDVLSVMAKTLPDPARTASAALGEFDALAAALYVEDDPARINRIGSAAVYLDRLTDVRSGAWRLVQHGRTGGPARRHLVSLIHLCLDDFQTGQWEESRQLAVEGLAVCEEHGYQSFRWYFLFIQAMLAAALGDHDTSRGFADSITQWAAPRGVRLAEARALHARILSAIGREDFEVAYQHAVVLSPAGTLASHVPHALWVAFDLVEAATRTGRHVEAAAHVTAMEAANLAAISPRLSLLQHGAAAITAPDSDAARLFERALSVPGVARWPFDMARVQLAYGERLRRSRATAESRIQLAAALEVFERLGALPWADRASTELRAAGQTKVRSSHQVRQELTSQEQEIAMLAATGLSNKEIAQRLFLSPKTIGNHLFRIFPKLGITSRAALRDALASAPDGQPAVKAPARQAP